MLLIFRNRGTWYTARSFTRNRLSYSIELIFSYLLEEEVLINELLLSLFAHAIKWIESTLEVTFKGAECRNNLVHNLFSLLFSKSGAKWVVSKVSTNSDSS